MTQKPHSPAAQTASAAYSAERQRAQERRSGLGIRRPEGQEQVQWALALSGGGIRSATFCLGVLQGLARSPGPGGSNAPPPLLYHFDYLSTVSGGGYIGGFLSSLYVPGRVSGDPAQSHEQAAQLVARVLQEDPPGRMHQVARYDSERPGRTALAWLRDNGRYLAPSGAGDYLYGVALALRNWVATHYVIGTAICLAMAVIALLRWILIVEYPPLADYERAMLAVAIQRNGIWWSTLWWLCLPILLLALLPLGIGFWFSYGDSGAANPDAASLLNKAVAFALIIGAVFAGLGWWAGPGPGRHSPVCVAAVVTGLMLWIACLWHTASYRALRSGGQTVSVTAQRVLMTRWLTVSLGALLLMASVAAIDSLSQTVRLNIDTWWRHLVSSGTGMAIIVWIARALVESRSEKESPRWLAHIPVAVLATGAGLTLWLLVASGWHLALHAVIWSGIELRPDSYIHYSDSIRLHAATVAAVCLLLALIVGLFPGFLNLSTLQGLYSARLTRSYLGASNHERFAHDHPAARSAAEPMKNDGLALQDIYRNALAPMHLINVCVNQTVDPAEQLVQRDRKGKPLVVAPNGFYLDGQPYSFSSGASSSARSEVARALTLGEWIGVSGAALTTGLGRSTGFGMSLLLGFANVRLGRWWPSGVPDARKGRGLGRLFRSVFGTHAYLLDEMTASFYGTRREYQYLSDGGHFENTAVYELLRPQRDIRLIVACDCGCDPNYSFRDLANLIRLARIDHGLELRINEEAADDPELRAVFGRPGDLTADTGAAGAGRCALLVDVFRPSPIDQSEQRVARMIVLKPGLIDSAPLDVANYQRQHPAFPQEPTGDQFYDEAQWESYRKLGLAITLRVFPSDPDSAFARAFWRRVMT